MAQKSETMELEEIIRFSPHEISNPLTNPDSDYTRLKSITYVAKRQMNHIYEQWLGTKTGDQLFSSFLKTIGL